MLNVFGNSPADQNMTVAEYLDQSAFDEKFEVDLDHDNIRNIYHVDNKYYVPVQCGRFSDMYHYATQHMVHPDGHGFADTLAPEQLRSQLLNSDKPCMVKVECRQRMVDGNYRWVQYLGIGCAKNGVPDGLIYFYVYDIQNQKDRQYGKPSTAFSITSRNQLTGLLISDAFVQEAISLIRTTPSADLWCCVAIDIQHFKVFSSWFGQEKSDYVLARIGNELRSFERSEPAVAAYFGHDNFALIMHHNKDKLQNLYEKIREIVSSYSNTTSFLPAIGVNLLESTEQISLDMFDKARLAAEDAKKSYDKYHISYFDTQAYNRKKDEYALLSQLQHAVKNHEISFYLQPLCIISSGTVVGAEALARWIKPTGEVIGPSSFIPLLEQNGFITELDKHVWEAVCRWLRSCLDRDMTPVPVSINVSQADLLSLDVASYLYGLIERYNVPPRLLKVEITESIYAENFDHISSVVAQLKNRGFTVYMDDFGTGYSSLNMLDKINVDVLKLDMAFMRKKDSLSRRGVSIVESIISMTRSLDIPVVVEGVENEDQINFLNSLGCLYAQGYYFYKPMSIADYEQLICTPDKMDLNGLHSRTTELFHIREFLSENLFTDTVLNNILGPVAFYTLDGQDLTITRYNMPFYHAIADGAMDSRTSAIQHYVVREDWPALYRALDTACQQITSGGSCEVRFYKSDGSIFWFRMRFFYLRNDYDKKLFYGQIEDVTESREQSIHFLEVLRKQADVTMTLNLDRRIIQYVTGDHTLYQPDLPSMDLDISISRTSLSRVVDDASRKAFIEFFDVERLRSEYHKAVYHELLTIPFRLKGPTEPPVMTEFSTYCIRHSKDQDLIVYAFAKAKTEKE